ncbi:unnamed protein product, partial (macronuclear) [Paramecium tetraurelia]
IIKQQKFHTILFQRMNCAYHIQIIFLMIYMAQFKSQCQRKLYAYCLYDHGVDMQYAILLNLYEQMVKKKLDKYKLNQTSQLSELRKQNLFSCI